MLAQDVRSALDVPPEDNSEMDGYALRAADVPADGTVLPVSQRIAAGQVGRPLQPGTAARIFTGAQVPPGADAVVMQELCEAIAPRATATRQRARAHACPAPAWRFAGAAKTCSATPWCCAPGTRLTPQAMGLAASVGAATLQVWRRPRVALFSTGDELAMPGEPLKPGAIYNSNRFTLRGLLQAAGCTVIDLGIVPDKLDATRDALRRGAQQADLVLTCGGVSVGEEDHLKPALQAEGRLDLWSMAIKPGKPLAFGAVRRSGGGEALYMGLPGNPVSSSVTFLLAVRPVLRVLPGASPQGPRAVADDRRLRLAAARLAARVPACAGGGRRHARPVSQPELGRADLDGVGRRPGRQPAVAGDRARRHGALPAVAAAVGMSLTAMVRVQVRYFASLREALGTGETIALRARHDGRCAARRTDGARRRTRATVGARPRGALRARPGDGRRERQAARRCRGGVLSAGHRRLKIHGWAVGGDAGPRDRIVRMQRSVVTVQQADFDLAAEVAALRDGDAQVGAVAAFVGTMRDRNDGAQVSAMELEHYPGMTERAIEAMVERGAQALWHPRRTRGPSRRRTPARRSDRAGRGASAHRREAFQACEFLMDYLKTQAPFWKKETTPEGARWVDARQADDAALARWGLEMDNAG